MTDALLLDTHIALWLDSGDARLRPATRDRIDRCWQGGGNIMLSAVTVWEIAMLVDTRRIALDIPVADWIDRFVARLGILLVPLDHRTACRAYDLAPLEHRDPADRLLIATAITCGCPLVSYDQRIRRFGYGHGHHYGFVAEG